MSSWMTIGRVLGPHGVRGWVRVLALTDDAGRFPRLDEVTLEAEDGATETRAVREARVAPNGVRLLLEGVEDRSAAEALRGKLLKAPREEKTPLPPDTYYAADLVGIRVETEEGEYLGDFEGVMETGSNDVYVVRHPETRADWLVPALKRAIRSIDIEKRLMVVRKDWVT
jgi:16S rRNA processing protein RimM